MKLIYVVQILSRDFEYFLEKKRFESEEILFTEEEIKIYSGHP